MTTYSMATIYSGTKIREDHNTSANVLTSVNAKVTVTGSEKWVATTGGAEVFIGDTWIKVTYNGVTGWMAYIHKGVAICNNFKVVETTPPPAPMFPESFVLTDPSGEKAEYVFVRVIE